MMFVHNFALDYRNHRPTATESKQSDFKKRGEKLK